MEFLDISTIYNFLNTEDTVQYNNYVENLINYYNIVEREDFIHYVDVVFSEVKWIKDNNIEDPDDIFVKNLAVHIHRNQYNWTLALKIVNDYRLLSWSNGDDKTNFLLKDSSATLFEDCSRMLDAGIEDNIIIGREDVSFDSHTELAEHLNLPYIRQTIETNNQIIDFNLDTARFSSAIWYDKIRQQNVLLAGCGGIGSYVAFLLSRLKPYSITLYDNDRVEAVNMAGQLYRQSNISRYKVDALNIMMREYSNYYSTYSIPSLYTTSAQASNIMICGFDNMEARKVFFNKWKEHVLSLSEDERKSCLFIDGRLEAEELQVFCITVDEDYNMKYETQ